MPPPPFFNLFSCDNICIFPVPTNDWEDPNHSMLLSCKSIFCDLALLTIHMFDVNCIHITHVRHKRGCERRKIANKSCSQGTSVHPGSKQVQCDFIIMCLYKCS